MTKMKSKIINGDCIEELKLLEENSVDAIVTDPPYGIGFMGKEWDNFNPMAIEKAVNKDPRTKVGIASMRRSSFAGQYDLSLSANQKFQLWFQQVAKECLRVLKPGGFLLSFGGTRTYHRMTCGIEDAGFEIRDTIMWIYGSGFPKSLNIGKKMEKLQNADYEMVSKLIINSEKSEREIADYCDVSPALVRFWRLNERSIRRNEWVKLSELLGVKSKEYFIDAEREVLEKKWRTPSNKPEFSTQWGFGAKTNGHYNLTAPATPEAKEWEGWGTALKPACEPIVVARKPLSEKNVALNVLKHGTGGINIDASRIEYKSEYDKSQATPQGKVTSGTDERIGAKPNVENQDRKDFERPELKGRFPSNIILDEEAGKMLDEQSGVSKSIPHSHDHKKNTAIYGGGKGLGIREGMSKFDDKGGASRFFYVAKASKSERNFGMEEKQTVKQFEEKKTDDGREVVSDRPHQIGATNRKNNHPTVKPIKLMEYLIKLISKENAIVLDPFTGSGTTGIACAKLNRQFIGFEKEEEYVKIAEARIKPFLEQRKLSSP